MKTTRLGGLAMMGLLLGCATASPPQQAPAATAQSKASDDALVCEDVPMTGSHIPRRICRTQRQINKEREAAQKALQAPERANRKVE